MNFDLDTIKTRILSSLLIKLCFCSADLIRTTIVGNPIIKHRLLLTFEGFLTPFRHTSVYQNE
jgi:hypothetical protein